MSLACVHGDRAKGWAPGSWFSAEHLRGSCVYVRIQLKKKLRTGCRILAERLDGLEEKYWKAVLPPRCYTLRDGYERNTWSDFLLIWMELRGKSQATEWVLINSDLEVWTWALEWCWCRVEADSLHSNAPGGAAGLFLGWDSSSLARTARQHGAR